jgi:hypothetical protein
MRSESTNCVTFIILGNLSALLQDILSHFNIFKLEKCHDVIPSMT